MMKSWLCCGLVLAFISSGTYAKGNYVYGGGYNPGVAAANRVTAGEAQAEEERNYACVAATAKPGDTVTWENGNIATILQIKGEMSRCPTPEKPIAAKMDYRTKIVFSPNARVDLPPQFTPFRISDRDRYVDGILQLVRTSNRTLFVEVTATKRALVSSMPEFVNKFKANPKRLEEVTSSDTVEFPINGAKAWQYEQKGKTPGWFGSRMDSLVTIIERSDDIIVVRTWGHEAEFKEKKDELKKIPLSLKDVKN